MTNDSAYVVPGLDNIGRWVRGITRWHRVESEIAGRYVTRCGRELAGPRDLSNLPGLACRRCA